MYIIIRLAVWIILSIIIYSIFRKKDISRRIKIILTIIWLFIPYLSTLFPIENIFYEFSSPESVLKYYNDGIKNKNIIDTVDGYDSCMVFIGESKNIQDYKFILKSSSGYKIATPISYKKVLKVSYGLNLISVYRIDNTEDYYIYIINMDGENINFYDSSNSIFEKYTYIDVDNIKSKGKKSKDAVIKYTYYYAHINKFNDAYKLYVNGKQVPLNIN